MTETYDARGWIVPAKPAHIPWCDYAPKRIRPFRSTPRSPRELRHGLHIIRQAPRPVVRRENDGPSLTWLAERDAAGTATKHADGLSRIERALVKDKSPLVITLRRVRELLRPPIVASNDNEVAEEGEDANPGAGFERIHNQGSISPSIPVLLRAYAPKIETNQRTVKDGCLVIGQTRGRGSLTGLIFYRGELIAYGDDKGRRRAPSYNTKVAEAIPEDESATAKHIQAQPAEDLAYTKLRAAGLYVSAQSPHAGQPLAPTTRTARAVANDNILAKAREATSVMPVVRRLPDGVAHQYGRLAGIAEINCVGATSAPLPEALSEMERVEMLQHAGIRPVDLDVIEDVLADASFRSIGLQFGFAESSASSMGRKVVERALRNISEKMAA